MSPIQQQRFNTILGGTFLATGLVAWAMAFFFAVIPNEEAPAPVIAAPVIDLNSCQAALRDLGYSVTVENNSLLSAFEPLTSEPLKQLEKASLAATVCKLPMRTFCMGEGCEAPGLTLTLLRPVDGRSAPPQTQPRPATPAAAPGATTP